MDFLPAVAAPTAAQIPFKIFLYELCMKPHAVKLGTLTRLVLNHTLIYRLLIKGQLDVSVL